MSSTTGATGAVFSMISTDGGDRLVEAGGDLLQRDDHADEVVDEREDDQDDRHDQDHGAHHASSRITSREPP